MALGAARSGTSGPCICRHQPEKPLLKLACGRVASRTALERLRTRFDVMRLVFRATRLSAGGVADEWMAHMLRQGDAKVLKKYSQMKLQMKREALEKINRHANEVKGFDTVKVQ